VALKNIKKGHELNEDGKKLYKNNKTQEAIDKWEECAKLDPYNKKFNS